MKRRTFIGNTAMGSIGLGLTSFGNSNKFVNEPIPRRTLGKTGENLSVIGFGGIMLNGNPQDYANDLVAKAYDAGVNYFDVAPSYGNALSKLGPALKPYRNKCFLACKTTERSANGASKELEDSLRGMVTDHFDLYQLHALSSTDEVEKVFAPGGAMEVFLKAREEGKVKYLGFSAHSEDAALLAMKKFNFDTILFPINFNCWHHGNFGPRAFAEARSRGMGILALKSMAMSLLKPGEPKLYKNVWYRPMQDKEMAGLALRYTLSKEITAAIPPGDSEFFWQALDLVKDFRPVTQEETDRLVAFAVDSTPVFSNKA